MATKHIPINPKQYSSPAGPQQPKTVYVDPNQYPKEAGPSRPTSYDKVRQYARKIGEGANVAYEAGAHAVATGHEIGQSPHIRAIASQSGFTQPSRGPRRAQPAYPEYQDQPSSRGETIRLTICDETGNCRTKTIKGGNPRKQRSSRGTWAVGGLGGYDPGFL